MRPMGIEKRLAYLDVPWEATYGYAQAVQTGNTIYVSGQLSHDDAGNLIGPAPVDASGRITDAVSMELQMRATYVNVAKVLASFGATLANVVDEVIYTTDVDATFVVAGRVRKEAYGTEKPECASTLVGTTKLAIPQQLVEISVTAVLPRSS